MYHNKYYYSCIFLTLLLAQFLIAGNTGKIIGIITDKQSKVPLIGANLTVQGTTLGAASNVDGEFVIHNIPPGTYSVNASIIGYAPREYKNVKISADLTTELSIELSVNVVEADEVVIVASRLIQKDATATAATIDAEQFTMLPVESFEQALQIQAGVNVGAGGDIHIRGGRSSEILFLVDGIPVNNAFDNTISNGIVATNAIQELSVISGAFNAEYGNAQSGVINITTKEGAKNFSGKISVQTGDVVGGDQTRFKNIQKIDPFTTNEVEGSLGGPLVDNLSFFASSRYFNDKGYLFGQRLVQFAGPSTDNLVLGDKSFVSMNANNSLNLQGKISYTSGSYKINGSYMLKKKESQTYLNTYRISPDYKPTKFENSNTFSLNSTFFITNETFLSSIVSYTVADEKTYAFESINDPLYRIRARTLDYLSNKNNPQGDSLAKVLLSEYGLMTNELTRFTLGPSLDRTSYTSKKINARIDISSQFDKIHLLKGGVEFSTLNITRDGISLVQKGARPDNDFNTNNEIMEIPDATSRSRNIYTGKPYEFAGYAQDKMEFKEFVINAGVRMDVYDPNTTTAVNFRELDNTTLKKTTMKWKISPRLSFAHSVTDQSKIFFSYGHFFQFPPYSNIYTGQEAFVNPRTEIRTGILSPVGGNNAVGNADLKPQTTISYEVGYEQELTSDIAMYFKGYYRNIRNLLATDIGLLGNGASYAYYTNRDYGNVRGINFTIKKRMMDSYAFSIDYTYQIAEGNASSPTQTFLNVRNEAESQKQVVYLDWDQPHSLRWTIDYNNNGWTGGLIGKLESGYPYTPALGSSAQGGQQGTEENSARKPAIFNVDFVIGKELQLTTDVFYGFTFKMYNVFDTQNELFVFSNSGRSTFSGDPAFQNYVEFTQRPDFFAKPRDVYFGTYIRF